MMHYELRQDPALEDKAVLYLRYSSEGQTENSIEGQRRECEEFAKKRGIDVLGEYVDRAKTGTNDNRPDFQRMVRDSYKKAFGNVIVWRSDRFSRDRLDALKYRRELASNGVKVLSVTEPNVDGPMGTLFDSMNDGMNQLYSEELSIKVKRGQKENVIKGRTLGGKRQLGYRIVDGYYRIDENEAPIIQEIFRLYVSDGLSILSIAKKLKAEGKRRSDGGEISHNSIEKLLASEKYIGVLKCDGKRNEHAIPAIVSQEIFDLCQQRRTKRKHKNFAMRGKEEYYLSGKVFCSGCGSQYLGESGHSHTGAVHCYYKCNGAKHGRCKARPIQKDVLELSVCSLIILFMRDDESRKEMVDYIYSQQKNEDPEVRTVKRRRSDVETQIANFAKAIGMGIVTETTKSFLLALESERNQLDAELSRKALSGRSFTKEEISTSLLKMGREGSETPSQKRELLNNFVKRIDIGPAGNITYQLDLFGFTPAGVISMEDLKKVRINTPMPRQWL